MGVSFRSKDPRAERSERALARPTLGARVYPPSTLSTAYENSCAGKGVKARPTHHIQKKAKFLIHHIIDLIQMSTVVLVLPDPGTVYYTPFRILGKHDNNCILFKRKKPQSDSCIRQLGLRCGAVFLSSLSFLSPPIAIAIGRLLGFHGCQT